MSVRFPASKSVAGKEKKFPQLFANGMEEIHVQLLFWRKKTYERVERLNSAIVRSKGTMKANEKFEIKHKSGSRKKPFGQNTAL